MFLGHLFALFFFVGPLSPTSLSVWHRLTAALAAPSPSDEEEVLSRVVAIGDVHGDLAALTAALRLGGLIGAAGAPAWRGGRAKCVVVGDMLDRGDDELEVLDLLDKLRGEARAAGGSVTCLLGNHEVMNACGDFRYTSPAGNRGFAPLEAEVLAGLGGEWGAFAEVPDAPAYPGLRTRAAAFAPGGPMARRLSRFPVAALIHGTLFVHAALTAQALVDGGSSSRDPLPLRTINRAAGAWLRGGDGNAPPAVPRALVGPSSLVWSRQFGKPVGTQLAPPDALALAAALTAVGARRMVIGHTPQAPGGPGINAVGPKGGGQCWRIDTGMARAMGGKVEALEITSFTSGQEARVRVLTEEGALEADQREAWHASDGVFF